MQVKVSESLKPLLYGLYFVKCLLGRFHAEWHPVTCLVISKDLLDLQNGFSCGFFVFLLIDSHKGSSAVHSGVLDETCKTTSKEKPMNPYQKRKQTGQEIMQRKQKD